MASELKIASALVFDSRSPISSSVARGLPMRTRRTRSQARPVAVVGALGIGRVTQGRFEGLLHEIVGDRRIRDEAAGQPAQPAGVREQCLYRDGCRRIAHCTREYVAGEATVGGRLRIL